MFKEYVEYRRRAEMNKVIQALQRFRDTYEQASRSLSMVEYAAKLMIEELGFAGTPKAEPDREGKMRVRYSFSTLLLEDRFWNWLTQRGLTDTTWRNFTSIENCAIALFRDAYNRRDTGPVRVEDGVTMMDVKFSVPMRYISFCVGIDHGDK